MTEVVQDVVGTRCGWLYHDSWYADTLCIDLFWVWIFQDYCFIAVQLSTMLQKLKKAIEKKIITQVSGNSIFS